MAYQEIFRTYQELKETLKIKKEVLIERNLEKLNSTDETIVVLCEKIAKFDIIKESVDFSEEEKEALKKLGSEIKELEENNEILIKHSLDVINEMLGGILNISNKEKCSYNSKGIGQTDSESLDISSIIENA